MHGMEQRLLAMQVGCIQWVAVSQMQRLHIRVMRMAVNAMWRTHSAWHGAKADGNASGVHPRGCFQEHAVCACQSDGKGSESNVKYTLYMPWGAGF